LRYTEEDVEEQNLPTISPTPAVAVHNVQVTPQHAQNSNEELRKILRSLGYGSINYILQVSGANDPDPSYKFPVETEFDTVRMILCSHFKVPEAGRNSAEFMIALSSSKSKFSVVRSEDTWMNNVLQAIHADHITRTKDANSKGKKPKAEPLPLIIKLVRTSYIVGDLLIPEQVSKSVPKSSKSSTAKNPVVVAAGFDRASMPHVNVIGHLQILEEKYKGCPRHTRRYCLIRKNAEGHEIEHTKMDKEQLVHWAQLMVSHCNPNINIYLFSFRKRPVYIHTTSLHPQFSSSPRSAKEAEIIMETQLPARMMKL
jgi:hypothetical protein